MTEPTEEPVAYLGGKSAAPSPPPSDEAPIEGYLGGDAPPDSLPALPPAGVSAVYSASDFIAAPPVDDAPTEEGPAYDTYAAEAPVAAPTEPTDYEQYAQPEPEPPADSTQTVVEQPGAEPSGEFDEPGLPKTISQQDAENIIKRITTKKILPPEVASQEGNRVVPPPELTPRGSPKLGRTIFVLVLLFGGVAAAFHFKEDIIPYLPDEVLNVLGWERQKPPTIIDNVKVETPEEKLEKKLRARVLESEWRAFGYTSKQEFDDAQKASKPTTLTPEKETPK